MLDCSKNEIIDKVRKQCGEKPFYRISILNNTSFTKVGIRRSDVIAEWLCNMTLNEEKELLLQRSHMVEPEKRTTEPIHKDRKKIVINNTNRDEENIAKRMMQLDKSIIDYQVPINRVNHSSEGKVDLIIGDNNFVIIGELKDWDSEETLLRAMVEARTYQLKVENCKFVKERFERCYEGKGVKAAVLMFENTQPWNDFCMMRRKEMKYLYKLAKKWGILFYRITKIGNDKLVKDSHFTRERVLL